MPHLPIREKVRKSFSPIAGDRGQPPARIGLREFIHVSVISVWIHILAVAVWIGGMAALGLPLVPFLQRDRFRDVARPLLYASALCFRWIGWGALGVLVVTGLINVRAINVRARGVAWSTWLDLSFWETSLSRGSSGSWSSPWA